MRDLIRALRFTPALDRTDGLRGFVSFEHGVLLVDGVTLHLTAEGEYRLSFPKRRDRDGIAHPYVRPLDPELRREITEQVIAELRRQGVIR
jgi:DNA-binding cell septation regulator SpoVG